MSDCFTKLLLIVLLLIHTSVASVQAASSINVFSQSNDKPHHSTQKTYISSIQQEQKEATPCPHHKNMVSFQSPIDSSSQQNTDGHDCSNCTCVATFVSFITSSSTVSYTSINASQNLAFIPASFPDSPPSFILRPPIS